MSVRIVAVVARIGAGEDRTVQISAVAAEVPAAVALIGARLPPGWEVREIVDPSANTRRPQEP